MLQDTAMVWFRTRERRSSLHARSKLSKSAARQQTFTAAMAQFTAAKVVTEFARPLNLYYGLAQAWIGDRRRVLGDMSRIIRLPAVDRGSPGRICTRPLGALAAIAHRPHHLP